MRMKRFCLTATLFLLFLTAGAQSVADLFVSMPTVKTPYLTKELKEKLVEGYKPGTVFSVTNRLQGETSIDTLATDYGRFSLSASRELTLALLPVEGGDSILLCLDTHKAPAPQSEITFYDLHWNELPRQNLLPDITVSETPMSADSVPTADFDRAVLAFELLSFDYDPASKSLSVNMTTPFLPVEKKDLVKPTECKRTLKWGGLKFN